VIVTFCLQSVQLQINILKVSRISLSRNDLMSLEYMLYISALMESGKLCGLMISSLAKIMVLFIAKVLIRNFG
jgi:hypothetical protein